jgi:hypothetical protein
MVATNMGTVQKFVRLKNKYKFISYFLNGPDSWEFGLGAWFCPDGIAEKLIDNLYIN